MNHQNLSSFIWSVADLLRGDYKQSDYGKVILPFTVLRRLDCVLEATKAKVLVELAAKQKAGLNPDPFLLRASGHGFYNTSPMDMAKLMGDLAAKRLERDVPRDTIGDPGQRLHRDANRCVDGDALLRQTKAWPQSPISHGRAAEEHAARCASSGTR